MDRPTAPQIDVVAGIIVDTDNQVLIAKRPDHLDQGGLWEFPGGKREAGESSIQALTRELYEELDIVVERAVPAIVQAYEYPKKIVNLEFFEILRWRGEARGKEGQSIRWVAKNQLAQFQFPPANVPVLSALRFPRVVLCASASLADRAQLEKLEHCATIGFSSVIFSSQQFLPTEKHQCEQIYQLCEKYGGQLILDCPGEVLADFPNAGIYLKSELKGLPIERPVPPERLLVCECHSLEDLTRAKMLHADAAILSAAGIVNLQRLQEAVGQQKFLEHLNFPLMVLSDPSANALYKALNNGCYGVALNTNDWKSATLCAVKSYFEEVNASLDSFCSEEYEKK